MKLEPNQTTVHIAATAGASVHEHLYELQPGTYEVTHYAGAVTYSEFIECQSSVPVIYRMPAGVIVDVKRVTL
jgi:hypothetical protein